jgi:hypothetical protein
LRLLIRAAKRRIQPERYATFFGHKFVVAPRHPWRGELAVFLFWGIIIMSIGFAADVVMKYYE